MSISQQVQKRCQQRAPGFWPSSETHRKRGEDAQNLTNGMSRKSLMLILRSSGGRLHRFINHFRSRFKDCVYGTKFGPFSLLYFPLWALCTPLTTSIFIPSASIEFHIRLMIKTCDPVT